MGKFLWCFECKMPATMSSKSNTRHKWRRTCTSRSKTGCVTCRRRRLKCDEEKPVCLRCIKSDFSCEGYHDPTKAEKTPTNTTQRLLLPKESQAVLSTLRPSELRSTMTDTESKYLEHFQHKTTSGFEGMMDWSIWNHLILQLNNHENFIYDSCIAIGALVKAVEIDESMLEQEARDPGLLKMAKTHREFALLKYGKAVKTMQARLVGAELRLVLVACLLIYCFENLANNSPMALAHVVSGQQLLRKFLIKYDRLIPNNRHIRSPAPDVVDDEIVEAFDYIDLKISTVYDTRSLELHRASIREGLGIVQEMPSTFNNLSEAQGYLVVVMRRSHHFLATTWLPLESRPLAQDSELSPPEGFVVTSGNIYSTNYIVSDALRKEQKEFAEEIFRWSQAFQPLLDSTRRPENVGSRSHLVGTLLRIHAIATTIVVAGAVFSDEISYDAFLPQFQELFTLTTIVVDAHRKKSGQTASAAGFFLDVGIAAPLYLLVLRCREHSLRAGAIELLRGWRVEAFWHPILVAQMGSFLMDVEEDGKADGFIPETSRAVITAVVEEAQTQTQRPAKHQYLLQCVQRYGGLDGGPAWHKRRVFF